VPGSHRLAYVIVLLPAPATYTHSGRQCALGDGGR